MKIKKLCYNIIKSKGEKMCWVYDFTAHNAYPFFDYFTAKRWYYYLNDIKGHDCEMG